MLLKSEFQRRNHGVCNVYTFVVVGGEVVVVEELVEVLVVDVLVVVNNSLVDVSSDAVTALAVVGAAVGGGVSALLRATVWRFVEVAFKGNRLVAALQRCPPQHRMIQLRTLCPPAHKFKLLIKTP
jgi:hypothetical protein